MASREEDKAMTGLLRRTLASDAAGAAGKDCLAPEVLAAYFDRALNAAETARYDLHFSQCSRCRGQLAAMARAAAGEKEAASAWWNWLHTPRWLMPTAAAFAVLVLIVGITLLKWKSVEVANDVAMSRPGVVLQPTPEIGAVATPSSSGPKVPATPPPRAAESKNQLLSGDAVRDKTAERQYLRVLPSPPQEKHAAREARGENVPAKPAVGSGSAAPNATAIVAEAPAVTDGQSLVLLPNKAGADSAARDSAALATEAGAEQPSVAKRKTSARSAASAPAAAPSRRVTGSNFAADNAREAAERARIQQAQMSSNLMAGFVVQTPDPNVLWMVSNDGSVGRSEDAGASWKYQSLETIDHLVAGSAPTAKICWLVGEHGTILRTTDGKTWTTVQPPVVANFEGFVGIDAKDESSATLTTSAGRKFSTTDGGTTWNLAK
jgi:hypothetical protein